MPPPQINNYDASLYCPAGGMLGINKCYVCPTGFTASKSGNEIVCTGTPDGQIAAFPGTPAIPAVPGTLSKPAGSAAVSAVPATPAVNGTCAVGTLTPSSNSGSLPVCIIKTQFQ